MRSKSLIQTQNKDLLDNITYAKRIQTALLPKPSDLKTIFPDHFLIFKPKDIVSGDFYWVHQTSDYLYFAVGDCTGHGVTGAFMSLLGISTLNEIVKRKHTILPNEILMTLNRKIIEVTRKSDYEGVNDGMDIAMCMINRSTNQLYFSGAGRPLLLNRNNELQEVKGDKRSISGFVEDPNYLFEQHQFELQDIESVYMFSDGIVDQFGGKDGKKFKKKRLKQNLELVRDQAIIQQEIHFQNQIETWMLNEPQVDDICMLGVDLNPIHWPARQFNRSLHSLLHK